MLASRARSRPALIDLLLMFGEWTMVGPASVHAISHTLRAEPLPICFFPVGLITEHFTFLTVEQRRHLRSRRRAPTSGGGPLLIGLTLCRERSKLSRKRHQRHARRTAPVG